MQWTSFKAVLKKSYCTCGGNHMIPVLYKVRGDHQIIHVGDHQIPIPYKVWSVWGGP